MQGKKTKRTCLPIRRHKRHEFHPWVRKIPWRRASSSTVVATHSNILAWRTQGQRSQEGYSPWGCRVRCNWVTKYWLQQSYIKCMPWDFPGGPVVGILPCNTGDVSSIPGLGTRILHAMWQLTPHATTESQRVAPKTIDGNCIYYEAINK